MIQHFAAPWHFSKPADPMPSQTNFQGLRTVIYGVSGDLDEAKAWYADVLGVEPYFDEPFYVGFDVGGYELGLDPDAEPGNGGAVAYWGVSDAEAALARLLEKGTTEREGVREVGDGIRTATVTDPFGNVLGVIENPHFDAA
jgi:predicted enzyme related to lactoylglutathione lyase